jgi:hypothetical protein
MNLGIRTKKFVVSASFYRKLAFLVKPKANTRLDFEPKFKSF